MFNFFRAHPRFVKIFLLLILVPSFALVGIESYFNRFGQSANTVATIGTQRITQQAWDVAVQEEITRVQQWYGKQLDTQHLNTSEMRRAVLEQLVDQHTLQAATQKMPLQVCDETLKKYLRNISYFHNEAGDFNIEKYRQILHAQGMTPTLFEARLRDNLDLQDYISAIQSSTFIPNTVSTHFSHIQAQIRHVDEIRFKPADFLKSIQITEDMLKKYYEEHRSQFIVPAHVKAEYLVLDSPTLANTISVSQADIQTYYTQNITHYQTHERRRARHILLAVNKDASSADKEAAQAQAEKILSQIKNQPSQFVQFAKKYSQDLGSSQKGGDLGWISQGSTVIDQTIFSLKEGQISTVVSSDFGYHIVQLEKIQPATTKPIDEVKLDIIQTLKNQMITQKIAEIAEQFNDSVYEQSDSLQPTAQRLGLRIQTVENLTQQINPLLTQSSNNPPYNHQRFLDALFSAKTLPDNTRTNTDVIEIAPNVFIAGRVVDYQPATKKPFEAVESIVRQIVTQTTQNNAALKAGALALAKLQGKNDHPNNPSTSKKILPTFSNIQAVSRTQPGHLSTEALAAVMKANTTVLPTYVGVLLPDHQGYTIYRINHISQETVEPARAETEKQQLNAALRQQTMVATIDLWKERMKAKILVK